MTTATTSTVLPCSSYLQAQSEYLHPSDDDHDYGEHMDGETDTWATNFGRSPECRSFAKAYQRGYYTFTECGISSIVSQLDDGIAASQLPAGVFRDFTNFDDSPGFCCGSCTLNVLEVRLYYFPDSSIADCHHNSLSNNTKTSSPKDIVQREQSLVKDESTAVVSGHTL